MSQRIPLQQPVGQPDVSQRHTPSPPHVALKGQLPMLPVHLPPQPSSSPQAAFAQLGLHPPHVPPAHVSAPEQVGEPAQQGLPFPPQSQAWQLPSVPQHPWQTTGSQWQAPPMQACPRPQPPIPHSAAQPSLPQALPTQLGVQVPTPQWFGPPAPQTCPRSHPPQSTTLPQRLRISPH